MRFRAFGFEVNVGRSGDKATRRSGVRRYEAGMRGRLYDWVWSGMSPAREVEGGIAGIRAQARDGERNNDYVKRYLDLCEQNVVGPEGMALQVRARDGNGRLDTRGNRMVEDGWRRWGRKGTCTVCGLYSWVDVCDLFVRSVKRDGECLVLMRKGWAGNRWRFGLQMAEADLLDERYNDDLPNGNRVVMGVEVNGDGRPVGYWLWRHHPQDVGVGVRRERVRWDADDVVHGYRFERIGSVRNVSGMRTAMNRLHQLGKFEEAEVIASRASACKMGFYKNLTGDDDLGDAVDGEDSDGGEFYEEAEPGFFGQLPKGWEFESFDPKHPNGNYETFRKGALRGASAGLGVAYNTLGNDLEGVNMSSLRSGKLDERDGWRKDQRWLREHLCEVVYPQWLSMGLLSGAIGLPMSRYSKFLADEWQGRGFDWVDPLKDVQADELAVRNGWKTNGQVSKRLGGDFDENIEELAREEALADKYGVTLGAGGSGAGGGGAVNDDDDDDNEDDEEAEKDR